MIKYQCVGSRGIAVKFVWFITIAVHMAFFCGFYNRMSWLVIIMDAEATNLKEWRIRHLRRHCLFATPRGRHATQNYRTLPTPLSMTSSKVFVNMSSESRYRINRINSKKLWRELCNSLVVMIVMYCHWLSMLQASRMILPAGFGFWLNFKSKDKWPKLGIK